MSLYEDQTTKKNGNRKNMVSCITTNYLRCSTARFVQRFSSGAAEIRRVPLSLRLFECNPRCSFFTVSCSSREANQAYMIRVFKSGKIFNLYETT
jgi:hypothetical protein